ncbi:EAL domain-containing protein [Telmatospirillum sp.]|uniref:putative bifunctional diguanylate cyclase/phosphodiesterase n=1 Tax=Telmatospirillum sp. TaxID=2079197 RepID=UPI00284A76EB|nr:EAL domain-containing protein [Telmatospirillum sp.]MDR3436054.1 EAL domain-containing protein [Telmatospirillum sp.]
MATDTFIDQTRFEDKLKESEARYRLLADHCSDMIASLDLEGRYLYVSPASVTLFGQTEDDLIGRLAIDFTHPDDVALFPAVIAQILKEQGVRTLTFRRRHKDGRYSWVESKVQGVRDATGAVTQIILTARDISERRQAEEDLRVAATAFETQEGMVITTSDQTILRVNQAFSEITGYAPSDAIGHKATLLKSGRHDQAFYDAMWTKIAETGMWRGEIWNRRKNGEIYPEWLTITAVKNPAGEVTHYVGAFTDITKRKATEEAIEHLAFYDPLTRLPNRRLLMDRLTQALVANARSKRGGALLFIDLDNFKTVNDTLGHDKGDLLLQQTAKRLISCVRKSDTVARLGGDEFVVMLEDLSANRNEAAVQARTIGDKILAALNEPYKITSYECDSSSSIGITLFCNHGDDVDAIIKHADLAMYRAKTSGRNSLCFFDPEMQQAATARAVLANELQTAVETEQFVLHYQPQVDGKGRLTGAEALLRWQHPDRGLISPADFIPLAEETGLMLPLGLWVLRTACRQLVQWAAREGTAHLTVSVNVSACQFRQADFVERVLETVDAIGADPTKLTLELTESMLIEDIDDTIAKMGQMKERGLSFSLDDFGTGYSSLAYLKSLPLSELKIDRSFITDVHSDPNSGAIAKTIVFLAQSLGLTVIAEGVETELQRTFLDNHGCRDYQGFLFSRPLPLDAFEAFAAQDFVDTCGVSGPMIGSDHRN